jgi:hypothetical protein
MHVYLRDRSFAEFGLKLQKTLDPDLIAIHFRGADFTSHGFWKFRAPKEVPFFKVSEQEKENPELSGTHEINGLLFCKGPAVRKGYRITKASIYDFLPTLLAAAGLPQAEDMPGRVLTEVMRPEFLKQHPPGHIKTYGGFTSGKQEKPSEKLDDEIKQKLRSLGYIQ